MPSQPVESLYVDIEANIAKLLQQTEQGVKLAEQALGKLEKTGKTSFDETGKAATTSGLKIGVVTGIVTSLTNALINLARQGVQALGNLGRGAIESNAQFETYSTQFEKLLGSGGAAQKRMAELAEFGFKTPFELPEIVEASRQLEIFGGATLSTGKNLTMIGDIASGVNQPFREVAFWTGRMYDAMQSGRPFGESTMRLQEMGILSGDVRNKLELLQKTGASGAEMWKVFSDQVGGRFAGSMERLSLTFQGIMSNLADFSGWLLRIAGQPAFETIKESALRLLNILEKDRPQLEKVAEAFGEIAANVLDFVATGLLDNLENLDYKQLLDMVHALGNMVDSARTLAEVLGGMDLNDLTQSVTNVADKLSEALDTAAKLSAIVAAEGARRAAETKAGEELGLYKHTPSGLVQTRAYTQEDQAKVAAAGQEAYNKVIQDAVDKIRAHEERIASHTQEMNQGAQAAKNFKDAHEGVAPVVKQEGDALDEASLKLAELSKKLTVQMIDAVEENQKAIEESATEHQAKMASIDQSGLEKRAEIDARYEDDLAKLPVDTAEKVAEENDKYQLDQRRKKEDFNREMFRLNLQLIDDIQDAVKNRDARAVVDAERKFSRDKAQHTGDFTVQQNREREDHKGRLRDLQTAEDRRRAELTRSHLQQLAELKRSIDKEKAQETLAYQQKQTALKGALAQRLATIARALADEEGVDAAHAQRLLAALNKTFGAGGDIDAIMNDFMQRRRQKMVVSIEYESGGTLPTTTPPSGYTWSNPYQPGGPLGGFAQGGAVVANRPTMALFGEAGPEVAQFTPMSQVSSRNRTLTLDLKLSGSAPPGIRAGDRDAIAGILLAALRDTGALK